MVFIKLRQVFFLFVQDFKMQQYVQYTIHIKDNINEKTQKNSTSKR